MKKVMAETQGRNLESGTEAEAIEERHLLSCSSRLSQSDFFIAPRTTHLGVAPEQ